MSGLDPPLFAVSDVVARALAEDLLPLGDLTGALVPPGAVAAASFVPRSSGVLAGTMAAGEAFAQVDSQVRVRWLADDGAEVASGQVVGGVKGKLTSILAAERTALNLLGHLSGVATLTRRYVLAAGGRSGIRDTRKTTPGLRALEKAAVRAGGGLNHRGSLSDGILVKDNHLAGTTIADAISQARARWPGRVVEVECDDLAQVEEALGAGAGMVLLDNMKPAEVRTCVVLVAGRVPVEVSGRVELDTVAEYADTGADFISVGAITHSAPVLDIGLDLVIQAEPEGGSRARGRRGG